MQKFSSAVSANSDLKAVQGPGGNGDENVRCAKPRPTVRELARRGIACAEGAAGEESRWLVESVQTAGEHFDAGNWRNGVRSGHRHGIGLGCEGANGHESARLRASRPSREYPSDQSTSSGGIHRDVMIPPTDRREGLDPQHRTTATSGALLKRPAGQMSECRGRILWQRQ